MTQKVIKIGKSTGVTIPKRILEEMNLKAGDRVVVEYDEKGNALTVTPEGGTESRRKKIAQLTENFIERYRSDLEELAKR